MNSSFKSWGTHAKFVRPDATLKTKDVNRFANTVTSRSRSKDASGTIGEKTVDANKDTVVFEYDAVEKEAANTLVLMSNNAYKELTQDRKSNAEDVDTDLD